MPILVFLDSIARPRPRFRKSGLKSREFQVWQDYAYSELRPLPAVRDSNGPSGSLLHPTAWSHHKILICHWRIVFDKFFAIIVTVNVSELTRRKAAAGYSQCWAPVELNHRRMRAGRVVSLQLTDAVHRPVSQDVVSPWSPGACSACRVLRIDCLRQSSAHHRLARRHHDTCHQFEPPQTCSQHIHAILWLHMDFQCWIVIN